MAGDPPGRSEYAVTVDEPALRMLFEASPQPMWIVEMETLRFLAVSRAARERYGYSEAEFLAMTARDIRPPEDVARLEAELAGGLPRRRNAGRWRHRTRDGQVFAVEVISQALRFNGRPARLAIARDVSHDLRAHRLRVDYEYLLQHAPDAIVMLSPDERVELVNQRACDYLRCRADEVLGLHASELFFPEDLEATPFKFWMLRQGAEVTRISRRLRQRDGGALWVDINALMLPDGRFQAILRDVSQRLDSQRAIRDLNAHLEQRVARLQAVHAIDLEITRGAEAPITLAAFTDICQSALGADAMAVFGFRRETNELELLEVRGFRSPPPSELRFAPGPTLAGLAVTQRRPQVIRGAERIQELLRRRLAVAVEEGFEVAVAAPMTARGTLRGVLAAFFREETGTDESDLDFVETLGSQGAVAIELSTLLEDLTNSNAELRAAYDANIEGWSRALDLRDRETQGHSQRVTELTVRLARRMGFGEAELAHVRRGALLHDIGKMGVPDAILQKPGALDSEEWAIMRRHTVLARDLLQPIAFLGPALAIPYAHHEWWDGSGYPEGLSGEAIPLAARIFAVVDVFDALTSDRPYRSAWSREAALEHIRQGAGTHFDPRVVDAFVDLLGPAAGRGG